MVNKRQRIILNKLSQENQELSKLASELQISEKSLQNDVEKINKKHNGLIINWKNQLSLDNNVLLQTSFDTENDENQLFEIFVLFNTGQNIESLANSYFISTKTLYRKINIFAEDNIVDNAFLYKAYKFLNLDLNLINVLCENLQKKDLLYKTFDINSLLNNLEDLNNQLSSKETKEAVKLAKDIEMGIFEIAKIRLTDDIRKMYIEHIKSSYKRYKYGFFEEYSLENITSKDMQSIKMIMMLAENIFNKFNIKINESESFFIAIFFVQCKQKLKIAIYCPKGFSSTLIINKQLEDIFQGFTVVGVDEQYDYLITNVNDISNSIRINTIFQIEDIKKLSGFLSRKNEYIKDHIIFYNSLKPLLKKRVTFKEFSQHTLDVEKKKENQPMLKELLTEDLIALNESAENWEQAIKVAANPLLNKNKISNEYIEAIIKSVKENGPYFVIMPHLALAHAKSDEGAYENAIGLTSLKKPVKFGSKSNDPVKYIFTLSSKDGVQHMKALSSLVAFFEDQQFFKCIDNAKDKQEILEYIKKFDEEEKYV